MSSNRVAVVTGAARGIGAETARRLSDEGRSVALIDLDVAAAESVAAEITSSGGTALALGADITDPDQVETAVTRVASELGPPVVLVNNAGITRDNLLFKMTLDDWDSVMNVHLKGAFLMTRAVQGHMTAQHWGRIVNVSSLSALGNRGQANYAAAKAGLQGFTKTLAFELGKFGVTANAVAPGFVASDMTQATAQRVGVDWDEFVAASAAAIPVQRVGQPADIAHAIAYLTSEDAGYVSGQVLYVTGGPNV